MYLFDFFFLKQKTAYEMRISDWSSDVCSSDLLEIFIEEGVDILDSAGSALLRWQDEPSNRQALETLLRDLHTLKGGARMVEIVPIGDLAHELENLYEGLSAGLLQQDRKRVV